MRYSWIQVFGGVVIVLSMAGCLTGAWYAFIAVHYGDSWISQEAMVAFAAILVCSLNAARCADTLARRVGLYTSVLLDILNILCVCTGVWILLGFDRPYISPVMSPVNLFTVGFPFIVVPCIAAAYHAIVSTILRLRKKSNIVSNIHKPKTDVSND